MATPPYVSVSRWRRSFKINAVNEDVRAQKDALENLNTQENIKDSNRYFAEKVWKILNFISQI